MAEEKEIEKVAGGGGEQEEDTSRFIPGERRSEDSSRRTDNERRDDDGGPSFEGSEQRQPPERRIEDERRSDTFDVTCKTSGSLNTIEDWLDDNCDEDWELVFLGSGADMSLKAIKVIFSKNSDKTKFIEKYGGIDSDSDSDSDEGDE